MNSPDNKERFKLLRSYRFQLRHLMVLLVVLVIFQILVSFINKNSLQHLLYQTQNWYQLESAERMANLAATSLELLLETASDEHSPADTKRMIQAINIIFSQQALQQDMREICLIIDTADSVYAVDDGRALYDYFFSDIESIPDPEIDRSNCLALYREFRLKLIRNEHTYSTQDSGQIFHVLVPFVPRGEYSGAIYIKNTPDFTFITHDVLASYNELTVIFAALIFLGLLAMFYISSYTLKERDEAQQMLFEEHENHIKEQIHHQKENQFTRRIYHTHHKAEKIMGFIKEDLRLLSQENMEEVKFRVAKYANFISRVIYDMKWYEPPVQSIRNPLFNTNINQVIRFLVDNVFLRISNASQEFQFNFDLDEEFPALNINEYVIWEILEPLIQNSIEHSGNKGSVQIKIQTRYERETGTGHLYIEDNGPGFPEEMLQTSSSGLKRVFQEHSTTKTNASNSGYGCYIAAEIARQRCNWNIDAENLNHSGCRVIISIPAQ